MFSSLALLLLAAAFFALPYLHPESLLPGLFGPAPVAPPPNAAALAPEPTATPAPSPTPSPTASPAAPGARPATATAATPTPAPPPKPAVPVRLRVPAIGVDAPIVGVGLLWDGEMEAPYQADQVGWFKLGTRPGEVGNALLDGHLDWIYSAAVFYNLGKLAPGDAVTVVDANGAQWRFRVQWKELVPADRAPLEKIVGPTNVPAVTLITCGGQWNRLTKDYSHRWVVRAVVAPPPTPPSPAEAY